MRLAYKAGILSAGLLLAACGTVAYFAIGLRDRINTMEAAVAHAAKAVPVAAADLPAPVERYFTFTFPQGVPTDITSVEMDMAGDFRRPLKEGFEPTTARQVADARAPNFVFSADTPIIGPTWAIAYDAFIDGQMEMKAKILSVLTVVDEKGSPKLDQISLRRWLLESPVYPVALLPGGFVRWEAVDQRRARAIVEAYGQTASLMATFRPDGSLERFDAEEDGDLTTPYHGSGEHTWRGDYRLVDGVMIPMEFIIARAAKGDIQPFWKGRIQRVVLHRQQ